MGWLNKTPYKHPSSECQTPPYDKSFGSYSRWECDECGQVWTCTVNTSAQTVTWTKYTPTYYGGWRD